jgi:hypothetical protein
VRANRALLLPLLAVAAVSSCTLLFAGTAKAGAAHAVTYAESFKFEAQLPSSDGFLLFLRGYGHRTIELDIGSEDPEEPLTTMTYRTTGRVDRHGIEADFGQFGRIGLRFSGSPERSTFPFPNCKATKPEVNQYGSLKGRIEFESLGGAVQLKADQVEEGQTWHAPKRTCTPKPSQIRYGRHDPLERHRPPEPEAEFSLQTFVARAHLMGRTIDLYAVRLLGKVIDMAATSTRRFDRVLVSTSVHAPESEVPGLGKAVKLSIFGSGPRPRGATLSASAPFSGSGTYRKRPGQAPSWLGSLAADIPGEGTLPLAGPGFHAVVCGYVSKKLERACERTVALPHLG